MSNNTKFDTVSYLRAGGRCPPVHLLVPGLSPSQAFLFLEARIWVWEDKEVRERPSPPGLRVRPLEPPVRCIWRRKLNSSWQENYYRERQYNTKEFLLTLSLSLESSIRDLLISTTFLSLFFDILDLSGWPQENVKCIALWKQLIFQILWNLARKMFYRKN